MTTNNDSKKGYLNVHWLSWGEWLQAVLLRRVRVGGEVHRLPGWLPFLAYRDYDPGVDSVFYAPFAQGTGLGPGLHEWRVVRHSIERRAWSVVARWLHEAWWHDEHRAESYPAYRGHVAAGLGGRTVAARERNPDGFGSLVRQAQDAWRDLGDWYKGIHVHHRGAS